MAYLLATTVMDNAAALLNDAARSIYPYTTQIPFLNMTLNELKELFALNNVPVTDTVSAVKTILAGRTEIGFPPATPTIDYLPSDLIEPKIVWERTSGIDPYTPMLKLDFLPLTLAGVEQSQLNSFVWQSQEIRFFAANADIDLKIDYIRDLFALLTAANHTTYDIAVINAQSFLQYRSAALMAQFLAENPTRAQELNADAGLEIDRALGISSKTRQAISIRHRPFRAAYKTRSYT